VEFTPPVRDSDTGHYKGLCFRGNQTWEVYDDLKDKVYLLKGNELTNVHMIIYTI